MEITDWNIYYVLKQGTDTNLPWEDGVLQINLQNTKTAFRIGRMSITASIYIIMVTHDIALVRYYEGIQLHVYH